MDFPPIAALCLFVPLSFVIFGIWLGVKSREIRWLLGAALAMTLSCSGLFLWLQGRLNVDEDLWGAAASGDMQRVEEGLAKGGSPTFRFDSQTSCIEVARENGHEEVARRLERAAKGQ